MPLFQVVPSKLNKRQNKKQNTKTNKYGGFMAKWGGPSGNLTWPLNPAKKQKEKNKTRKQNKKQN